MAEMNADGHVNVYLGGTDVTSSGEFFAASRAAGAQSSFQF